MTHHQLTQTGPAIAVAGALDARTRPFRHVLLNSAAAVTVALSFWASAVGAQDTQTQDTQSQDTQAQGTDQAQQSDQSQQSGEAGQTADGGTQAQGQGQGQGNSSDALIATVGDAEIRNSDLMRAIGALPPQLSSQPPEMVASMAMQQLVMREAILQQARSQGLAEDPEVQSLVEGATQSAEEDALVQVWLQREIANRVTPEAVDGAYAGLQAIATEEVPPLEQIRSQIQQSLAQQAMNDLQGSLLSNTQVTIYGPDGQPIEQQQGGQGGQGTNSGQGNTGDQSGNADQSGGDASGGQDQSQGDAAGESGSGGEQDSTGEQSSGGNN